MNAPETLKLSIPALGHLVEGGFFHGVLLVDGKLYGEVTGPAADCFVKDLVWLPDYKDVPGATSASDGLANTRAMAEAGSPLGQAALACRSGGFDDWYVPARVGALLQHGNLKPLLDAAEAFDTDYWYWTSTQCSRDYAWSQYFLYGNTGYSDKSWSGGAARFVRRFPLIP
ncbi:MAG: hypothetical protein A2Z93_14355 [Curvibacter sp. GWA2_64_110]|nr:MAG: hypothetical protein A2Z93_14355 [Curvibacter sp. GWA2_64_110]